MLLLINPVVQDYGAKTDGTIENISITAAYRYQFHVPGSELIEFIAKYIQVQLFLKY